MKKYFIIAGIIIILLSLAGCKACKKCDNNNNSEEVVELSSSDIYKNVNKSVVLVLSVGISGDVCSGTGFFIDEKGTFVTNYHVIKDCESVAIKTSDNEILDVKRFVAFNKAQDIAILQADTVSVPAKLGDSSSIEVGEKVYTIGYPAVTSIGISDSTFTEGIISKTNQTINGKEYIQTTVSVAGGNEGGPLINKRGEVIGVIAKDFNYDNVDWANLAIGINHTKNLSLLPDTEENLVKYYFRQEIPYIITYVVDGEVYKIEYVLYNGKATQPENPSRQGHTFINWIDSIALKDFNFDEPIKNDYLLIPYFEVNSYTLSFNTNGGTEIADVEYKYDSEVDLSMYVPIKTGYTFVGWDKQITSMPSYNVTLNAIWEPNTDTPYQVDYFYENDLGEYEYKESKTFNGTTEEIANVPEIPLYLMDYEKQKILADGSLIIKCYVTDMRLTIQYHSNNGEEVKVEKVKIKNINEYNQYIPIKDGFTFECWYEDETANNIYDNNNYRDLQEEISIDLYAKYKEETLWTNFTFDSSSNVIIDYIGDSNDIYIPSFILDIPVKEVSFIYGYNRTFVNVIISEGIEKIINGYFPTTLENITIPASAKDVDGQQFAKCNKLENIYYNGDVASWVILSAISPKRYAKHLYMLNEDKTYSELTNVIIPEGVTKIGGYAFSNTNIESITIAKTVINIADFAFINSNKLSSVVFETESQLTSIGSNSFANCTKLESIEIPNSVTNIYYGAFDGCTNLKRIYLGKGLVEISSGVFKECTQLTDVYYNGTIEKWLNIMKRDMNSNPMYYASKFYIINSENKYEILEDLILPDSVTVITSKAFYGWTGLKRVTIPDSVITIEDDAFANCESLESVVMGNEVISIGASAFKDCISLKSVSLSEGLININNYAFKNCTSLTSIIIPDSVTEISREIFMNCTNLKEVELSSNIRYIPSFAFANCTSLEEIIIPSNVTDINQSAFESCTSLESITLSEGVNNIYDCAFKNCTNLRNINIPSSIKQINASVFENCISLEKIVIPKNVTNIGYGVFVGCNNLTIYCEVASIQKNWNKNWNISARPVVWNYVETE